ncbi:MAG TPA: IPT/TIG domain-containing protein [Opitutaceae bacterium]
MQKNRFLHARRIVLGLAAAVVLGLTGCQGPSIVNLTPDALAENPSQIYTISARFHPTAQGLIPGSVSPKIIIDGQAFPMTKSQLGNDIWEFEYQIPAGRTEVAYYFLLDYTVQITNGETDRREDFSPVHKAQIAGRYVLSLEVNRGPVGAQVSILGRGFTASDTVYFDDTPVRTAFQSPNALTFFVPGVETGRNYRVSIGNDAGRTPVGTFRVDAVGGVAQAPTNPTFGAAASPVSAPEGASISVSPSSLNLASGEKVQVTFTSPVPATSGTILIDVTTDVPESVIMPEVNIPQGQTSATVTIEGGRPGSGNLFVKGPGAREVTVPIVVR